MTDTRKALLEAEDRMELTEKGWIEEVSHPAHSRACHKVSALLDRAGVPEDCVFQNLRLAPDADGKRYSVDVAVILPDNPVQPVDEEDYAGAPDLAVEVVSSTAEDRERDFEEKRRRYARRGIGRYWVVDPTTPALEVVQFRLTHELLEPRRAHYGRGRPPVPLAEVDLRWLRDRDLDAPDGR
jgi:Uma2 family endonuclease